jgi:hypothetical protein
MLISKATTNIYTGGGVIWGCHHCHKQASLEMEFTMFAVNASSANHGYRSYPVCSECFCVDEEARRAVEFTEDVAMGNMTQSLADKVSRMSLKDHDGSGQGHERVPVKADRYILAIGNQPTRKYLFNFVRELLEITRTRYDELAHLGWHWDSEDSDVLLMSTWGRTKLAVDNRLYEYILPFVSLLRDRIESVFSAGLLEDPKEYRMPYRDFDSFVKHLLTSLGRSEELRAARS